LREQLLDYFHTFPPPLAVFLVAMLPIFELRGAIPAGYAMGMSNPYWIYALAVAGNFVPVLPILLAPGPAPWPPTSSSCPCAWRYPVSSWASSSPAWW